MCGIIAEFNTKVKTKKRIENANEFIINQFEDQHLRGQKGFGIIRVNSKNKIKIDRACETTKFLLDLYEKKSKIIIAHHRQPTSTENKMMQTHPIKIENESLKYDYYVVHNGIITNDRELKEKHEELGFYYTTEIYEKSIYKSWIKKWNDSEAIAIELALFIENKIKTVRSTNTAAFIVLQINKKTKTAKKVFFGKNGMTGDLNIDKIEGKIRLSSEGMGETVKENQLYSFSINDSKMKISQKEILFEKEKEIEKKEEKKESVVKNNLTKEPVLYLPEEKEMEEKKKEEKEKEEKEGENDDIEEDKMFYRAYRNWVTNEVDYTKMRISLENNYITKECQKLVQDLKETNSKGITHIIDDTLDEQLNEIIDLMTEYKEVLYTDQLKKEDLDYYKEQLALIMNAMLIVTNIADVKHKEVEQEEEETGKIIQSDITRNRSEMEAERDWEEHMGFSHRRNLGY